MTNAKEIKVGDVVRFWDFTMEIYSTGVVQELEVPVLWKSGHPRGVRIGTCYRNGVTRTYEEVELVEPDPWASARLSGEPPDLGLRGHPGLDGGLDGGLERLLPVLAQGHGPAEEVHFPGGQLDQGEVSHGAFQDACNEIAQVVAKQMGHLRIPPRRHGFARRCGWW